MSSPDLIVIDGAIKRVETDRDHHTCIALAVAESSVTGTYPGLHFSLYARQYTRWVFSQNEGAPPVWWNSEELYKKERLAALRGFRQACIDAAKKGKKS